MHYLPLIILAFVFLTATLVVGRRDGVRCLSALTGCVCVCICTARAAMLPWVHPLTALILCAVTCLMVICFALLPSPRQAFAAFLGAGSALVVAAAVAAFFTWQLKLTGVFNATMRDLWYGAGTGRIGLHFVALGGMIVAGTAIIADLAIAVMATMTAVRTVNPGSTRSELVVSGLRLGGDVTGTEVNTLIFALLGLNLGAVLLPLAPPDVSQAPFPWLEILNRQATAVEIVTALAGTLGLTLAIPFTALIGAGLMRTTTSDQPRPAQQEQHGLPTVTRPARTTAAVAVCLVVLATVVLDRWLASVEYVYPDGKARIVRGVVETKTPSISAWTALNDRQSGELMQKLQVRTKSGVIEAENIVTGSPVNDRIPDVGEEVLVRIRDLGHETYAVMREHARDRWLVRLAGAVSVIIILVFGRKGALALAALCVSLAIVLFLPGILIRTRGSVLPLTIIAVLLAVGSTYLILCGRSRKTAAATGGALIGILLSCLTAIPAARMSGLSGLHDPDMAAIYRFSTARTLDFRSLLVASMILGTIGVVMDVAMAVASAVAEVARAAPHLDSRTLHKHGMAVGRKVMGAMVMALALAYMGVNFGMFLLPYADPGSSIADIIGTERVFAEVMRMLVGITAVVWTVPATAWLAAALEKGRAT